MTYIADPNVLADILGALPEAYNVTDCTDEQTTMITAPVDMIIDALIASGAVLDAATLADDGAVVNRLARAMLAVHDDPDIEHIDDCTREVARAALRALAAALTERSEDQ